MTVSEGAPDKYQDAKTAFAELKAECRHTGKILTVAAVARKAQVDRKYLYGEINTPDEKLKQKWKRLGEQIQAFRNEQRENPDTRTPEKAQKLKACEEKLENALRENYGLFENAQHSKDIISRLTSQRDQALSTIDELRERVVLLESERTSGSPRGGSKVVALNSGGMIISPDALRDSEDKLARKKSWVRALDQLRNALMRPVASDLYLTIGIPGSGKSHWVKRFHSNSGRSAVIFDSTAVSRVERYDILDIARKSPDTRVIAVCFITPVEVAISRNQKRPIAEKVPEERIREMFNQLEYPSVEDKEEIFDEIMIVREGVANE